MNLPLAMRSGIQVAPGAPSLRRIISSFQNVGDNSAEVVMESVYDHGHSG